TGRGRRSSGAAHAREPIRARATPTTCATTTDAAGPPAGPTGIAGDRHRAGRSPRAGAVGPEGAMSSGAHAIAGRKALAGRGQGGAAGTTAPVAAHAAGAVVDLAEAEVLAEETPDVAAAEGGR